jgi:hypothetical protein
MGEGFDAKSLRGAFVEGVGPGEHGQQIDDVLFRLFVDVELLTRAGGVKGVAEKLAKRAYGYQRSRRRFVHAWRPFVADTILSTYALLSEVGKWAEHHAFFPTLAISDRLFAISNRMRALPTPPRTRLVLGELGERRNGARRR